MKVLKIVFISLAVLIALLAAAAVIVIKTVDINKYKPQIVEQADKALARQVDFQNASLGIGLNGIGLRINGLTVSEDPAFGEGRFLSVKSISVGVDVLGYLLRRQVSITGIVIDAPSVTIIRNKDGAINAQTVAKPAEGKAQAPAAVLPALLISSIRAQGGTVRYVDHSFEPAITVEVADVAFQVDRLSLTEPFPFALQAAVFSGKQNIRVVGKCRLDLATGSATVTEFKASTDLAKLGLAQIPKAVPLVPAQAMPAELKGAIEVDIPELKAGAAGLGKLNADLTLADGYARFKEMGAPLRDLAKSVKITEKDMLVNSFSGMIGDGTIKGSGWLKNYLAGQDFQFDLNADKLSLKDLIAQEQLPVKMEGLIAAKGQVKGHGFTPEALRTNLVGNANAVISQAKLKDMNVLKTVLDKISVIPGLSESLQSGLPENYRTKLAQKDTVFSDITVPVTIVNGRIVISETQIISEDLFIFKAQGDAGFDGSFSMEGSFLIPRELSLAMVAASSQLQYLLNQDQMIYIPLKVNGLAGAKPQFKVDARYMTKKIIENQGQAQLMKLLGGGQQGTGSSSDSSQAVGKLLKGLFK